MEGGAAGKLRLKRKRGGPAAGPPGAPASSSSWIEREDLSDAENTWLTLLRAVDPQLNLSNLEKMVRLPKFHTKNSQTANPPPEPETFKAGTKQFQWAPFPLYCREGTERNDSRNHQNSENETVSLMDRENSEDERFGVNSPASKQVPLRATEESRSRDGTKRSTVLEEREKWVDQPSSPGLSSSTTQNYSAPWKGATLQSEAEGRRENEISENGVLIQHKALGREDGSRSPARESLSAQERTEDHALTLDQCPMCQIRFTRTMSTLDLDNHLAKCLSESTEDVIW